MLLRSSHIRVRHTDKNGQWLDGSYSYKLHVPANPPVEQFWSIVVHSWETRTLINKKQGRSGQSSRQGLIMHDDGSVALYYGPTPPESKEKNWMHTIPGRIVTSQHLVQNHAKNGTRVIGRWLPRHTHNWHRSIVEDANRLQYDHGTERNAKRMSRPNHAFRVVSTLRSGGPRTGCIARQLEGIALQRRGVKSRRRPQ